MRLFFILTLSLLLSSCGENTINIVPVPINTQLSNTLESQAPLKEDLSGTNGEYYPIFHGLETKTIHIKHHAGTPTIISFINSEAKAIDVSIVFPPHSVGANLRWSQVIMPDGTMDGPFGEGTRYNLKQLGGYQLIFNENSMAGGPWSGEADITLVLRGTAYSEDASVY